MNVHNGQREHWHTRSDKQDDDDNGRFRIKEQSRRHVHTQFVDCPKCSRESIWIIVDI
jgi:hypothetical protein